MGPDEWRTELRTARKARNLTEAALAKEANVSLSLVKSYEGRGRFKRDPSRESLTAILDALKLDRRERDAILLAAGFAPDGIYIGPAMHPDYFFTLEQAREYLEQLRWPAFAVDDFLRVPIANRTAQALWGVNLAEEFTDPFERNLLSVASNPRFADRVVNWDEMVSVAIAIFKGHHLGPESVDRPSPSFSAVLERFMAGEPRYAARLGKLWEKTLPRTPKVRWDYPIIWDEPGVGQMRFLGTVTTADDKDGLGFNDWIPGDAETWSRLGAVMERERRP